MFLRYIFIGPPHKFLQVKGNLIALPFFYVIQFVIVLAGFPLSEWYQSQVASGCFLLA